MRLGSPTRPGFAPAQLLVVVALGAASAGLLVPGVRGAREAAARAACQNNLRQLGRAVLGYESANRRLPHPDMPLFVELLPHLGEGALYKRVTGAAPDGPEHRAAVATPLPLFRCPSSPGRALVGRIDEAAEDPTRRGGVSEYGPTPNFAAVLGPPSDPRGSGALCAWSLDHTEYLVETTLEMVTDGASNTMVVTENSDPAQLWVKGRLRDEPNGTPPDLTIWSGPRYLWPITFTADGGTAVTNGFGPCAINCNNTGWYGVYSFHPGGVNAALLDGSVRYVRDNLPGPTLYALVSRAGGEVLGPNDY